jgi:hypothetical protein
MNLKILTKEKTYVNHLINEWLFRILAVKQNGSTSHTQKDGGISKIRPFINTQLTANFNLTVIGRK